MKTLALAVASLFTVVAPAALAQYDRNGNYDRYGDYDRYGNLIRPYSYGGTARVIDSRPAYEAANSREECWNPRAGMYEERRGSQHSAGVGKGTVLGAIAGGVLGHQFGSSSGGRDRGTAAGAIIGGLVGNQIDRQNSSDEQNDLDLSRCRMVSEGGGSLIGYDVRYEYNGRQYTTRLAANPGRTLRVGEQIRDDGTPFDSPPASYSYADPYRR